MRALVCLLLLLCGACTGTGTSQSVAAANSSARGTQVEFERVMARVGETLGPAHSFRFEAEVVLERPVWGETDAGFRGTITVEVRRPDRFRVAFRGEREHKTIEYDGRSLALIDHDARRFARFPVGVGVRSTLARCEELGLTIPFAALLHPDPRRALVAQSRDGRYAGIERDEDGDGALHELSFRLRDRTWEAWIREERGSFLPVRIRVGSRDRVLSEGELGGWNLRAGLALDHFAPQPPPGSVLVPFADLVR